MEVKNENEKKFFNENNNFGSNNLINSQIINRNTKQVKFKKYFMFLIKIF